MQMKNSSRHRFCIVLLTVLSILFGGNANGANQKDSTVVDTSKRAWTKDLPEFFVTATRTQNRVEDIPARLASIGSKEISLMPSMTADALLELVPGANIDRANGIFSKNASITLRGLNGSPRILVLLDGIPLNKADGGGLNWNRIIPEFINRIEVSKGPTSAVYGSNAMGGVINIITDRPSAKIQGQVKAYYGSYNTFGGLFSIGGKFGANGPIDKRDNSGKEDKGFYYTLNGFYRQGDGYIMVPDDTRDSMDVKNAMKEGLVAAKIGYQYDNQSYTEIEYNYFNDKRFDGFEVYEPGGGYNEYPTHAVRLTSNNKFKKAELLVSAYYQNEFYHRLSESMAAKKGNKYTLYKTDSRRIDQGIWSNLTLHGKNRMTYTIGLDLRSGSVDASDTYLTATDVLQNKGKMDFFALFGEYEWHIVKDKLVLLAGIRYDVARFHNGSFTIFEPTTLTAFMAEYPTTFSDATWQALSPKLGLRYKFSEKLNGYLSYSRGFRPAMLDDMCKNGNVTKGFKLANPQLKPETIDNYEAGVDWSPIPGIILQPSVYLSEGHNFQYFVSTGDSINTGGDKDKPIIRRENVSGVQIIGAEISARWQITRTLRLVANYAFNDSRITSFNSPVDNKDLTGKYIVEVPRNQAFAGIWWNNPIVQVTLTFNYKDFQWNDDENTVQTGPSNTFDLRLGHTFAEQFTVSATMQDIFNTRYYDSKGNLSPGRFIMLNLAYGFRGK
jgi:iron complex outermembrane receptor protein